MTTLKMGDLFEGTEQEGLALLQEQLIDACEQRDGTECVRLLRECGLVIDSRMLTDAEFALDETRNFYLEIIMRAAANPSMTLEESEKEQLALCEVRRKQVFEMIRGLAEKTRTDILHQDWQPGDEMQN